MTQQPNANNAIRRGVPREHRRDWVFYLLDGGWLRFFSVLIGSYLVLNTLFAGLYRLRPDAIANCRSLADAFFFSVQTISTIGYGNMHPTTRYGDIVMTIEAGTGLLFIAMLTGLMVAKASRAKASVVFSRYLVVGQRFGKPTLQCRLGNAKGNEVVDARFGLAVLIDEITPEGEKIRRIHDLKLKRSESPFFMMTMVMMHDIDESSPLWGLDWTQPDSPLASIVATVSGLDATFGQQIHARHFYSPEDILMNKRYVDVIQTRPDGRFVIDYANFHNVHNLT
ncbi:ATP-sensitive inward rectifier potassium channel 10 [bacterium]|nr:ATP-sensitive inward rectifier potassium channel 10 [bacterium]